MKKPKTSILLLSSFVLLIGFAMFDKDVDVGNPVSMPDGHVIFERDFIGQLRVDWASDLCLAGAIALLGWVLVREVRKM